MGYQVSLKRPKDLFEKSPPTGQIECTAKLDLGDLIIARAEVIAQIPPVTEVDKRKLNTVEIQI